MDNPPQDLYTIAALATFTGSSGAVLVLYNTFRVLLRRESVWAGFIISLVVSFIVAYGTGALAGDDVVIRLFLAFLNACLLFTSALGAQELLANQQPAMKAAASPQFWSSWLRTR